MDGQNGIIRQSEVKIMRNNWIVSYDISNPKRLRKVAKFLEGYGVTNGAGGSNLFKFLCLKFCGLR